MPKITHKLLQKNVTRGAVEMVKRSNATIARSYFLDREKDGSNPAAGSYRIPKLAGRDGKQIFWTHRSHVDVVLSSVLSLLLYFVINA
jgi:hypothetical protein